jgi:CHAD domain-containing protein
MTITELILLHWFRQKKIFLKNLEQIKSGIKGDAVHDLRVAVKKLRAYLNFFHQLSGNEVSGIKLIATETLFKTSGKYRDFDISLEVLQSLTETKFNPYISLKKYLGTALKIAGKNTMIAAKKYSPDELSRAYDTIGAHLLTQNQGLIEKNATRILHDRLNLIHSLAIKKDEEPHELRKELKEFYYWLSIMPEGFITAPPYLKKLDKILAQLGTWQDYQVTLKKARRFRKEFVVKKTSEYQVYLQLERKLPMLSNQILDNVQEQMQQLVMAIENPEIKAKVS